MTQRQLEALLIDQALGELSEEASALLEAYLEHFPECRAEAEQVRRAVGLTETAVASRPLALEPATASVVVPFPASLPPWRSPLRSAAAIALLGLALGTGYFAGMSNLASTRPSEAVVGSEASPPPSPWARYRIEEIGRLAVILPSGPNS